MKGFYLYCVRKKSNSAILVQGIDEGAVFAIPEQDLEAIVSEVSLEEFASKEIQRKAQEDLRWIKEKAQLHEKIIEEAMGITGTGNCPQPQNFHTPEYESRKETVIPMKFGTIFKTKEKLKETLRKHYSKFNQSLENLTGKQEWTVKAYLNRKALEKELKEVSPVVQEKEKEIAQYPEGMAYFMQKQIDDAVAKEVGKVLENYTESFFENFKKYVDAGTKGKILEKELTGKSLPMVLNSIFLVSEEKLEDFIKEIAQLNKEYKPKGFNFEYSGPWPPYHFVA